MNRTTVKREIDLQIISEWIEPGARVLDLGCGRGILLEHLRQTRQVYGVGVDADPQKILGCVKRGVSAFQGDILGLLAEYPPDFFDWVILSRTLQELPEPARILREALRVGRQLAVGFINYAYWRNRLAMLQTGQRVRNEVFPHRWHEGRPIHPVTVKDFERYCAEEKITLQHRVYLKGNWHTPISLWPNLRAGYAVYHLSR